MSALTLKLIALGTMLYDHLTVLWPVEFVFWMWVFPEAESLPGWAEALCSLSPYIGRIAAPIFLFSLAQGYRHTRNWRKYALRLLLFACLAEWPYYLLFGGHGNILFTLLLGLLALQGFDILQQNRPRLGWALGAGLVFLLEWLHFPEGGGRYILFILVFDQTAHWSRERRALLWLVLYPLSRWRLLWLCFAEGFPIQNFIINGFGPLLGVGLTLLYNGEKGTRGPRLKYLWYIAYPAHLLLLALWKLWRGF